MLTASVCRRRTLGCAPGWSGTVGAVDLLVTPPTGDAYQFEATSPMNARWVAEPILTGHTYPCLAFVDARVVVDVGANCGAASVYFAQRHPMATVHAIEPGGEQRACMERNVRGFPNVVIHPIALGDVDGRGLLYAGEGDTGLASLVKSPWNSDESEEVAVRSGVMWAQENGIDRIDVLKVDAELSELAVFSSLKPYLPETSVVYLEYGSRHNRRAIHRMLDDTHDLYLGMMSLDQGECTYLRRDLAELDVAKERLVEIFVERKARQET